MRKLWLPVFIILFSGYLFAADTPIKLTQAEKDWIAQGYTVRVRVGNWPPYQIHDGEKLTGVSVDYIKEIFDKNGIKYELVSSKDIPWKEALEDVAKNLKIDLLLTAKQTPERQKHMLFTYDYIFPPLVIFTRNSIYDIHDLTDLKGRIVAVEENYVMQSDLAHNFPDIKLKVIRGSNTTPRALKAVSTSEADAYVGNITTGSFFVENLDLHNLKIVGSTPFGNNNNAMAVRRDWPELVSIINKSLNSFSMKFKSEVVSKYYNVKFDNGVDYVDITFWVALTAVIFSGILFYVIVINRKLAFEIKQRKEAENEVNKYLNIIDQNVIAITLNSSGIIIAVSTAYCRVSEMEKDSIIGKHFREVWSENMSDRIHDEVMESIRNNSEWHGEVEKCTGSGGSFWTKVTLSPKYDRNGKCLGYVSIAQDITARKLVEKLSVTDKLTGINNRLKLDDIFCYEIEKSRRYKHIFSVIMIDVDDFKDINDSFGHQAGDTVLRMIAMILQDNTRSVDTVGRWGGDEFMLICPETNLACAKAIAEKIHNLVGNCQFPDVGRRTVSIGFSCFNNDDTLESLLERADKALYRAKNSGKDIVVASSSQETVVKK